MAKKQKIVFDDGQFPLSVADEQAAEEQEKLVAQEIQQAQTVKTNPMEGSKKIVEEPDEMSKEMASKIISENTKLKDRAKELEQQKKEIEKEKLQAFIQNPSRVLCEIKAIWPFDFFPDEIRVEEQRVNIITRNFFWSAQVHAMSFKDIKNVEVQTSIFFAKLRIASFTMIDNILEVNFLHKDKAMQVRRIIEGLRILTEQGIDFSKISTHDLLEKVEELGRIK